MEDLKQTNRDTTNGTAIYADQLGRFPVNVGIYGTLHMECLGNKESLHSVRECSTCSEKPMMVDSLESKRDR